MNTGGSAPCFLVMEITMAKESHITTNKYGKTVFLPRTEGTKPEMEIANVLESLGIYQEGENEDGLKYVMGFFFDETGYRRKKYDLAILKYGKPKLLIEYDGEAHYQESFFEDTGVRPERCTAHVVRAGIGEAIKSALAAKHGVPYLRLNSYHMEHIRDLLIAYIEIVVNEKDCLKNGNNEILMIDMLDKYGWDFPYIPPSSPTKAEAERINRMFGHKNE